MMAGIDATVVAATAFTLFAGTLVFGVKVHKLIGKALDDQAGAIRSELEEAKRLRAEAEALRASYVTAKAQAETDAAALIAKAKADAEAMRVEAEKQLAANVAARTREADERIRRAEELAVAEVRSAASLAAVGVAERILAKSADGAVGASLLAKSLGAIESRFGA
jgi:F-type H+-transporting ATPase subunit b